MAREARTTWWLEFATADSAIRVATHLRDIGMTPFCAYSPYEVQELQELIRVKRPVVLPWLALLAAVLGGGGAFLVMWWTASVSYPLNVGGRPLNSLPTDIPIVFESAILCASVAIFSAALLGSGMPRLHHELEPLPEFRRASIDRVWVGVRSEEALEASVHDELKRMGALHIHRLGEGPGQEPGAPGGAL